MSDSLPRKRGISPRHERELEHLSTGSGSPECRRKEGVAESQHEAVGHPDHLSSPRSPGRRRAGASRRGHLQLTERDLAILRDLTRFWALTVEQIARRHFRAVNTAANRVAALVGAGYIRVERPHFRGRAAYLSTSVGARHASVGLPSARFIPTALPHRLAVVDLADVLLARCPEATWICERELRRDSMLTIRDRHGGQLLAGTPHVPDGVLTYRDGHAGSVAIELELSRKTLAEYERILRWYGGALDYREVWWFCATNAIRQRISDLVERERMNDFISVELVPAGIVGSPWG